MFKKNICAVAVLALFTTGCVQKDISINGYDLANHWFSVKNLDDNKIVLNKNFTEQYNDGSKTSAYTDFNLYKKSNIDNQLEQYTFFEDINKDNYKTMISNKNVDLKYNILPNEIKESFVMDEKQISSYKRNIKIKDKIIEESDIDGNVLTCIFSNYYENMSIKDKVNEFFKSKYSTKDKNYNNVLELSCKDSYVDGEYHIYLAKDIGTVLFMRKDMDDGSLEESFSVLDTQTILD